MKARTIIAIALTGVFLVHPGMASSVTPSSPRPATTAGRSASIPPALPGSPARELDGNSGTSSEGLALLLWCMSALADGNFRDAQKACSRAIKLDRWNPAPYKLRGASYLFQKRFEQARVDFAYAVRLDPSDSENHAGYAEALRGQGKYREAIAQFSAAIRLAPNDPRMWNARCWTRGAFARRLPEGLADCNTALRLAPGQPDILDSRGLVYLRMGRLDGETEVSSSSISADRVAGPFTLATGNKDVSLERISGDISVTNRNGEVNLTDYFSALKVKGYEIAPNLPLG